MKHARLLIGLAAVLGFLAVGLGAFGAHGLEDRLKEHPRGSEYWSTATHYALVHAAALVGLSGFAARENAGKLVRGAAWCWFVGSVIFAGTLMLIATGSPKWLGAITPVGGTALLIGWLLILIAAVRGNVKPQQHERTRDNSTPGQHTKQPRREERRDGRREGDRRNDRRRR